MALTQEQTNIDLFAKQVAADVKATNIAVANNTTAIDNKSTYLGQVPTQAAMVALAANKGDWCVRTDLNPNALFVLTALPATTVANWIQGGITQPQQTDNYSYVTAYSQAKS